MKYHPTFKLFGLYKVPISQHKTKKKKEKLRICVGIILHTRIKNILVKENLHVEFARLYWHIWRYIILQKDIQLKSQRLGSYTRIVVKNKTLYQLLQKRIGFHTRMKLLNGSLTSISDRKLKNIILNSIYYFGSVKERTNVKKPNSFILPI